MEEYMQGLLKDLKFFKRKIGDDKQRFLDGKSLRTPLGTRRNV
jgi:hypothetical protein